MPSRMHAQTVSAGPASLAATLRAARVATLRRVAARCASQATGDLGRRGQSELTDDSSWPRAAGARRDWLADRRAPCRPLPLEVYVAQVLSAEGEPNAAEAAAQALAVAIRTYALFNAGRHQRDGYDLCDTTHCQVLRAAIGGVAACGARHRGSGAHVSRRTGRPLLFRVVRRPHRTCGATSGRARRCRTCRAVERRRARGRRAVDARADARRDPRGAGARRRAAAAACATSWSMDATASGRVGRVRAAGARPASMNSNDFRARARPHRAAQHGVHRDAARATASRSPGAATATVSACA